MATSATPAGLRAPSAGRARSSRTRILAISRATSATATSQDVIARGSARRVQIPVVDLSEPDAVCASIVRTACDSCGFFHVVNHGVDDNLAFDVIRWGATFFDRPWDDKMALVRGDMRVSRGYEISPEHIEALDRDVTREEELAAREPSAARRIISERFSVGPFDVPNDSYHTDEEGALFFHPNAWPEDSIPSLRPAMEAYYREMESLCARLHRVLALAMGAPADFFEDKIDKHCSNLQVANYPSLDPSRWRDSDRIPLRKKSHADSGTLTVLWRSPPTEGTKGGLQVLDDTAGTWVDVPVLPGGNERESGALLINLGNQTQRWTDGKWVSTKHRVTNPDVHAPGYAPSRRLSVAFFHKANYDAVIDHRDFVPGRERDAPSVSYPPVRSGDVSRVGALRRLGRGVDAREASMRYHEELMGGRDRAERAAGESTAVKIDASAETEGEPLKKGEPPKKAEPEADRWASLMDPRGQAGPISAGDLGLDRGASAEGAGAGNDNPAAGCPVCRGTGWKPCGQCGGTGINREDLFGGKFKEGDTCWLCSGKKKTMCGNCVDLTDSF